MVRRSPRTQEEIIRELQANKDLAERNMARIKKVEDEQKEFRELITAVKSLATEQKNMRDDLTEMKTDVKSIKEKPGKRWDAIFEKILLLLTTAAVTYILLQLGISI